MEKLYKDGRSRCFAMARNTRSGEVDRGSLDGIGLAHISSLSDLTVKCKRGNISGLTCK
jgi:hypothetical protein